MIDIEQNLTSKGHTKENMQDHQPDISPIKHRLVSKELKLSKEIILPQTKKANHNIDVQFSGISQPNGRPPMGGL